MFRPRGTSSSSHREHNHLPGSSRLRLGGYISSYLLLTGCGSWHRQGWYMSRGFYGSWRSWRSIAHCSLGQLKERSDHDSNVVGLCSPGTRSPDHRKGRYVPECLNSPHLSGFAILWFHLRGTWRPHEVFTTMNWRLGERMQPRAFAAVACLFSDLSTRR